MNNLPAEGTRVVLSQIIYSSGTANNNFQPADTVWTDINGNYSMLIDREKAVTFKLVFSKNGYFSTAHEFSSDEVSTEEAYTHDQLLDAESWVEFHIANLFPAPGDELTFLKYNFREDCLGCTDNGYEHFYEDFDTTFLVKTTGGKYALFEMKNEVTGVIYKDSVYTTPFDTVYYEFEY